ncbi:MAG: hypothetical protein ACTSUB_09025 [Candidatus Thorarchaeota archaeon]
MDLDGKQIIVPVNATRIMQLAGGPQMIQAVPQEYYLSASVLRAIEERKGQDLDFIISAYLPVRVVPLSESNDYAFIDLLGFTSSSISIFQSNILDTLHKIDGIKTKDEVLQFLHESSKSLQTVLEDKSFTVPGLVTEPLVTLISKLTDWPKKDILEQYSLILPPLITDSDQTEYTTHLRATSDIFSKLYDTGDRVRSSIESVILSLIADYESGLIKNMERLDQRITVLEDDVLNLESRIAARDTPELQQTYELRKTALHRDISRRDEYQRKQDDYSGQLLKGKEDLFTLLDEIMPKIDSMGTAFQSYRSSISIDLDNTVETILLIPFIFIGYSKKGRLRIDVETPSILEESGDKVSLRKDFVDPFVIASTEFETYIKWLEERANQDVTFRKMISEKASHYNLLSITQTRKLILDGAKLLLADGFAKESVIEELEQFLKEIPEHKMKGTSKSTKTVTFSSGETTQCKVIFHISDETGQPIDQATIDLGLLSFESDERGRIQVSLPKSHYEGQIEAEGYYPRTFDFSLVSTDDIVIPITLSPLSHEEKLAESLDLLIERAKRIDLVRSRLGAAFKNHGATLLKIPAYRSTLTELLRELGHDPETWISRAKTESGMVKRLLTRNEREDGIVRDILHLATKSKQTGGIMLLSELLVHLDIKGWETTPEETERALTDMIKDGLLQGISNLENGTRLVTFIPVALTDDPQKILSIASQHDGNLTIETAVVALGWSEERVRNALDLLVSTGVAKLQKSYSKSTQYWFPGFRSRKK